MQLQQKSGSTDTSCCLLHDEEETQDHIVPWSVTHKADLMFALQPIMRIDADLQSSYVTEMYQRICSFHKGVSMINKARDADVEKKIGGNLAQNSE